jgi:DNA-binding NarL/FixJ family response regulator
MKSDKIKIAIADDHAVCRDGLTSILNPERYLIIGQVNNGKQLIDLVHKNKPDVIFLDIQMPILDGIEATKQLKKECPTIKIIVLSMFTQENCILEMIEAGADGYLVKSADKHEIIESIDYVLNDDLYLSKEIEHKISRKKKNQELKKGRTSNIANLSDIEIQIIKLICDEYTSEEIGKLLFLSKRTIDGTRIRIQHKIDATSTAGIVRFAIENGIYRMSQSFK